MAAPAHIARENGKKGGRPKGSTTRPQLRDMLSQDQIDALVAKGIAKAAAGDSIMLKFMLEQVFGKAPQPLTGADGGAIEIKGVEITVCKKVGMEPIKVGFKVRDNHLGLWKREDWRYAFLMGGRGNGRSGTASRF